MHRGLGYTEALELADGGQAIDSHESPFRLGICQMYRSSHPCICHKSRHISSTHYSSLLADKALSGTQVELRATHIADIPSTPQHRMMQSCRRRKCQVQPVLQMQALVVELVPQVQQEQLVHHIHYKPLDSARKRQRMQNKVPV